MNRPDWRLLLAILGVVLVCVILGLTVLWPGEVIP